MGCESGTAAFGGWLVCVIAREAILNVSGRPVRLPLDLNVTRHIWHHLPFGAAVAWFA
jgi:hypothetical protein